ncbi:hypothetical protein HYALB_00008774 [Hymenoscyphus albidus]|uniref:Nuclear pore complex subunit Nup192 n=1 Tax=Hymenoscyphus albidus TaxID=595503 RepID=A0A9N9LI43_9HELO|nr:hypothetical protein HYALB_00008774 [Hymenoscyphus albidus]
MAGPLSSESFRLLCADLEAIADPDVPDALLKRVSFQLDELQPEFKALLDKNAKNTASRQSLATGILEVSGDQYNINSEYQQEVLQLAEDLNLDELEAARLYFHSQSIADVTGESARTTSTIEFHQRRRWLLDCLRLLLQNAGDVDQDEQLRAGLQDYVDRLVAPPLGSNTRQYAGKCLSRMADIRSWLQGLADRLNTASVVKQGSPEFLKMVEFQQSSLVIQHELLGVILVYLIKQNYSVLVDFELLLATLKKVDKYDDLLLHCIPPLGAFIARFGGIEGGGHLDEAKTLNDKFFGQLDQNTWTLSYLHAAFRSWWLAEYSGWYGENSDVQIAANRLNEENDQRSRQFTEALKDGAFDFLLCVSADAKPVEWHDPARQGLRQWLQRKTPVMLSGPAPFLPSFQGALMEQLETFIEAFITNLPDVLRNLRTEEDQQRQLNQDHDHDLDLERFLVITSFVFEGRPKAALEGFWDVRDGALMGFLHWASRRASTPLVTTFCEMLQSISEDEACATAAHEFLLDEGSQTSGKMRRTHSLSWSQIFKELTYFSTRIRDRLSVPQTQTYRPGKPHSDFAEVEPEQSLMLESYLRLITRLCSESGAVRSFLAQHPSFRITDLLFQLASSAIGPRLRACAFSTLRSLLSHKTKEAGECLWTSLDVWISGGYAPGNSKITPSTSAASSPSAMGAILKGLTSGFEEPNAFVQLIHALVSPDDEETALRDGLPFPESLGAASRMPGIDPYVDFAVGQVFGSRIHEIDEPIQQRLMRLTCLDFIGTCLGSFNEDIVIFGSQSNVAVDLAISASNLEHYVLLHPFSRVMEWMYNDKVMAALFAAIHQDPAEVGSAASDSPLILSLLRGINVVTLILELQSTYLDIIRPLIRSHPTFRRTAVPNAAFTSFEDGVLSNLSIVSDLGLYCGKHPELTVASLKLLEKLSSSPRLTSASNTGISRGGNRNKAIAAIDSDSEEISKLLLVEMEAEVNVNKGPDSQEYMIKIRILDFLISCLEASPNKPTVAHLLLGFQCGDGSVTVDGEGPFGRGVSLFHTILGAVVNPNLTDELGIASWLLTLSHKALQVLKALWSSPLTSDLVMLEMRSNDTFFMLFIQEDVIQPGTLWDGMELADPQFPISPSSSCLAKFMGRRAMIFQYLATELRQISQSHLPSLKSRIFETLMGSTKLDDGQMRPHAAMFDLFDFMEPQFNEPEAPANLAWFHDINLKACLDNPNDPASTSNLVKIEEILCLRRSELFHTHLQNDPQGLQAVNQEAQQILDFYAIDNKAKILYAARMKVLRAWIQLMLLMLETNNFDRGSRTSTLLRTLQTIMPRLESNLDNVGEALELSKLAKSIIFHLDFDAQSFNKDDMGDLVSDRLFHLFQVSLKAISSLGSKAELKQTFYAISYRYLTGMADATAGSGLHRRHSIQTIKSAGDRFIDVICDDAHASEFTGRVAALLILGALVKMGKHENSKYIIDSLTRLNFISLLVGSIAEVPNELRESPAEHVDIILSYAHARLALLLHIAQTRYGATAVLGVGLFHAIQESGLFVIDPDLGVDIVGPNALTKHYLLLTSLMRLVLASILSRGAQNQQTLNLGRSFLTENKRTINEVLKKSAGLAGTNGVDGETGQVQEVIDELADCFMLLMSFTGFIEDEETQGRAPKRKTLTAFT